MASLALCQRELKPLVSRSAGREALKDALELYVGYRGTAKRRFTMSQLEEGSGVKRRVIECVMEGADSDEYRKIEIGDLLSLAAFLGAPFVSAFIAPAGLGAFELSGQAPLPSVLATADEPETTTEKRRRLLRELQALEDVA